MTIQQNYKNTGTQNSKAEAVQFTSLPQDEVQDNIEIPEESKVGKKLSELTTKRVIVLVLAMMFGLQLFETTYYLENNNSYKYGLETIAYFIQSKDFLNFKLAYESYILLHQHDRIPLIYLEIENSYTGILNPFETSTHYEDLRNNEIEFVVFNDDVSWHDSIAVFDLRADTRLQAILSILRTIFICIVLGVASVLFSKDANVIILGPIENMIQKVTKISTNPLKAAQEEEEIEFKKQQIALQTEKKSKEKEALMETELLEKTIIKIGALLALGFGEAGSEIIAQNMSSGGGEVNPMIPGKKTMAIFGFCDIRDFTVVTEVLQAGVMVFVNEIAEIVHSVVYLFSGSANKNIGDAFLLAWKFPKDSLQTTTDQLGLEQLQVNVTYQVQQIADMALISFLKIIVKINQSQKFLKYRQNVKLQTRIENYKVKMGFGLHYG